MAKFVRSECRAKMRHGTQQSGKFRTLFGEKGNHVAAEAVDQWRAVRGVR